MAVSGANLSLSSAGLVVTVALQNSVCHKLLFVLSEHCSEKKGINWVFQWLVVIVTSRNHRLNKIRNHCSIMEYKFYLEAGIKVH